MPYEICFFKDGIVPFNREYISLNQHKSGNKMIYGETVRPSVWLYDTGSKPWESKKNEQNYYENLEKYLPKSMFNSHPSKPPQSE